MINPKEFQKILRSLGRNSSFDYESFEELRMRKKIDIETNDKFKNMVSRSANLVISDQNRYFKTKISKALKSKNDIVNFLKEKEKGCLVKDLFCFYPSIRNHLIEICRMNGNERLILLLNGTNPEVQLILYFKKNLWLSLNRKIITKWHKTEIVL